MADTAPAKAPTAAIGYTHAPTFTWWLDENETTPELQFPQSIRVFDSMRRTDSQVTSVLEAVCLPVERTPWRIDPNGARDEVVRFVADDFGLPIAGENEVRSPLRTKGRFSWGEHLRLALLMLPYGFSYFEQLYRVDEDGSRAHLAKLEFRPHTTIDRVEVATDGGLVYVQQYWTATNREPRPIPVDRLVAYVHRREGGNWLGMSILRPVYKNWLLKDRLLRVQAQTIERNGMGIPVYEGAETEASLSAGLGMATSLRSGEAAGAATPFGAKLRLMGVEGTLPDAKPAVEYHDQQIARAVLAHFLNLGTQTGSWALGSTFADFFTLSLQTLAQQIASTTTQHVIEDLVDVNWGPNEPAPKLCFDEIGSRQQATAEALKSLVDAGIIHPDEPLEGATRQFYGLPPADPASATLPPGQSVGETVPPQTQTGEYSVAAKRRSVRAKYDPSQLRDPHSGEWTDGVPGSDDIEDEVADLVPELLGAKGGKHPVAAFRDAYGDYGPEGGRVVSIGDGDHKPNWAKEGPDGGEVLTAEEAVHVARGLDSMTLVARTAPTPAQGPDDGPAVLGHVAVGSYHVTAFHDGNGDLWGEGERFIQVRSDSDWQFALDAPPGALYLALDVSAAPKLANVMREMAAESGPVAASAAPPLSDEAAWIAAAAGVDTHPGGEKLKRYWVYGEGAAKWATWTDLFEHLRKYIENTLLLKATVSAWYKLRYGHMPPHHVHASADLDLDDEAEDWELSIEALSAALDELSGAVVASFNPRQPRNPKGAPGGGRFRSIIDHLKDAIEAHGKSGGKGHPFDGFDREQLRRVAVKRGIKLKRGEDRDSIAAKLLGHLGGREPKTEPSRDVLAEAEAFRVAQATEMYGPNRREWPTTVDGSTRKRPLENDGTFGHDELVEAHMHLEEIDRRGDEGSEEPPYDFSDEEILAHARLRRKRDAIDGELVPPSPAKTWDELGRPEGAPPVGQVIGHEGGTYERLPGDPRRYRVIAPDGRDISDQVTTPVHVDGTPGHQTAGDARAALAIDAYDRARVQRAHDSGAVTAWDAVPGSYSYDDRKAKGFRGVDAAARERIRTALERWTGHKSSREDATRIAEPTVNAALRGAVEFDADIRTDVAALDRALDLSRTKNPITVYRGVSDGTHILPPDWRDADLTGMEWTSVGYTPTTGNLEAAEAYTGSPQERGFTLRLHLPKGSSAVAIRDDPGSLDDEGEIVLPRGMTFRVAKDNGPQGELGLRLLDVEIVPAKASANPRAEKMAERQSKAGQKTAGVGVREPSAATKRRRKLAEYKPNAALDEADRRKVVARDRVGEVEADAQKVWVPAQRNRTGHDQMMVEIARRQHFDAKPHVVTAAELDAAVDDGWIETWRGVTDSGFDEHTAAKVSERLRIGEYEPGTGIYGNGIYVSGSDATAELYAHPDGKPGEVSRIAIDPKARMVDYDDLLKEYQAYQATLPSGGFIPAFAGIDENPGPNLARSLVMSDIGRWAAARGIDVIRIGTHWGDGAELTQKPEDRRPQYNILNRSVLKIQEAAA